MVTFFLPLKDKEIHPSIMLELLKNPSALLVVLMNLDGDCHSDVRSLISMCGQVFAADAGQSINVGG